MSPPVGRVLIHCLMSSGDKVFAAPKPEIWRVRTMFKANKWKSVNSAMNSRSGIASGLKAQAYRRNTGWAAALDLPAVGRFMLLIYVELCFWKSHDSKP